MGFGEGKGKIQITASATSVVIKYTSKQSKKGITYTVTPDGKTVSAKDA